MNTTKQTQISDGLFRQKSVGKCRIRQKLGVAISLVGIQFSDGSPTDFSDGSPTAPFTDGSPTDVFTDGSPTETVTVGNFKIRR